MKIKINIDKIANVKEDDQLTIDLSQLLCY